MSSKNLSDAELPTAIEIDAAARELHHWGVKHGWWTETSNDYDSLDPIGRDEFEAIVERVLVAAAAAKRDGTQIPD